MLSLRGITKRFPEVLANDNIDLDVFGGEVHAVLGENGAGKSTLMKVLYGFYRPDAGQVLFEGRPVAIRSPQDSRRLRIGMVFQHFTLVANMTVAENIALFLPDLKAILDLERIARRIEEVSERYGLHVDPKRHIWQLSIGEQQKVEVLKLLLADARVLIFDEPTSVLAPHEVEGMFQVFARLKGDGYAVLFITHKLREVLACADRITVLRHGAITGPVLRADATEASLVAMMFGGAPPEPRHRGVAAPPEDARPVLELKGISTRAFGRSVRLKDIDLSVMPNEIVGVAGVSGNGQTELGQVALGLQRPIAGSKLLSGQDATNWSVERVRERDVALIPEDPMLMGVVPTMTVQENMALADRVKYSKFGGLSMDWRRVRTVTEESLRSFGIRIPPLDTQVGTLSGGNLQRVVLARELGRSHRLLIAFHPTRGLDVPSAAATRDLLIAARDAGSGVLLISEDLGELFSLSDRLIVIFRGEIVGRFRPEETNVNQVGHLMTGSRA